MGDIGDFFSNVWDSVASRTVRQIPDILGGQWSKAASGMFTGETPGERRGDVAAAARDAADAKIKQAEYEEQAAMGAERSRAKRRRGFQSTILTGAPTTLGSSGSGKDLLGE